MPRYNSESAIEVFVDGYLVERRLTHHESREAKNIKLTTLHLCLAGLASKFHIDRTPRDAFHNVCSRENASSASATNFAQSASLF